MTRTYIASTVAGALLLGFATAALAVTGQFDNMCAMGLAVGKEIKTDCKINEVIAGLSYCFADDGAKTMFMKDPQGNLAKAQSYYSKKDPE